ncbi:triphosphoribosyl-dephospho-CoA synthase [Burkholderia sp. YR290]|jgi:triphosphoribosyl-dephospho-CoA synthase|uniref:triphosphoribosyl-dephospho-CoA synthase n=1 Tax=Paraburkholderia hospita TaxID=169430 RepID=UPI0009A67B84|nr:triphosphoribosyl-dephospho-CoA synthase [Paraburkholderia hospita]SKD01445.1 triphosphoribosyl-dephospho-CoA synthase [Paraburkholderia hospita]SOE83961.1 triphosphoribosyl-dephospho-CoA synthase [Burkholderia sp. YR290]
MGASDLLSRAPDAFLRACRLDVETAKPGNVSIASAGHGMQAAQFIDSAEAAAPALFARGARVGTRILDAVTRTQQVAGCNTNLGIVLLVAPLAAALEPLSDTAPLDAARWQASVENVLSRLDVDDARAAYRAIALANPGGLGDAPEQSVHAPPTVDLREAMSLAAERDSIARQYANGFADIFGSGLDTIAQSHCSTPTAITLDVFLTFLGAWPDSHILRKHGVAVAQSVTREARERHAQWLGADTPAHAARLDAWDAELKAQGVNPGTSADLSVATLFVAALLDPQRFTCDTV